MRNLNLIIGILLFPILLFSQSGTTLDEYKYLTKGYAYQKDLGLDGGKSGYEVKSMFTASNGVQFNGLFTQNEGKVKGVLVVINQNSETSIYLGLPTNDASASIKNKAEEDAKQKLNLYAKEKYDKALLEFAMFQLSGERVAISSVRPNESFDNNNSFQTKEVEEYNTVVPLEIEKRETMAKGANEMSAANLKINNSVKSNHDFKERTLLKKPVVKGESPTKGTVVIKMCLDLEGNVKSAKFTQRGSTTFNAKLKAMAIKAAKDVKFSEGLDPDDCGLMTFIF